MKIRNGYTFLFHPAFTKKDILKLIANCFFFSLHSIYSSCFFALFQFGDILRPIFSPQNRRLVEQIVDVKSHLASEFKWLRSSLAYTHTHEHDICCKSHWIFCFISFIVELLCTVCMFGWMSSLLHNHTNAHSNRITDENTTTNNNIYALQINVCNKMKFLLHLIFISYENTIIHLIYIIGSHRRRVGLTFYMFGVPILLCVQIEILLDNKLYVILDGNVPTIYDVFFFLLFCFHPLLLAVTGWGLKHVFYVEPAFSLSNLYTYIFAVNESYFFFLFSLAEHFFFFFFLRLMPPDQNRNWASQRRWWFDVLIEWNLDIHLKTHAKVNKIVCTHMLLHPHWNKLITRWQTVSNVI